MKLWKLICVAALFSSCVSISNNPPDPIPPTPGITALTIATDYQSNTNNAEFYICGNQAAQLEVNIGYRGSFSSYTVVLVGENNPNVQLIKGPFAFDADNGDTADQIVRTVTIGVNDIKPTSVATQAMPVTPIPPQSGGELGLGAFRVKVQLTSGGIIYSRTANAVVRILGNSNPRCAIAPPPPAVLNTVSVAAPYQNTANSDEFYICGNTNQNLAVTIGYSGTFTSYRVILSGELNPDTQLVKGPFTFDAANGDTATVITREVTISTNDVKPTNTGVRPQAVIVTPAPPQTGGDLGLGAFRVRVEMTNASGTVSKTSSAIVRVLGTNNSRCAAYNLPTVNSVRIATRFVAAINSEEFYLCGNLSEPVAVSFTYSGLFSSYRLVFVGELNPDTQLIKGPFAFDAANGDTLSEITREVVISQNDIKPSAVGVRTQAVIATPIPPPPSNTVGFGAIRVRVELTGSGGVVQRSALGRILVFGNTSPRC